MLVSGNTVIRLVASCYGNRRYPPAWAAVIPLPCFNLFFSARTAHKFAEAYMDCLNSSEPDVVLTAAKFLPEFIVLDNGQYKQVLFQTKINNFACHMKGLTTKFSGQNSKTLYTISGWNGQNLCPYPWGRYIPALYSLYKGVPPHPTPARNFLSVQICKNITNSNTHSSDPIKIDLLRIRELVTQIVVRFEPHIQN